MAELIPALSSCLARMTAGEKRFARRLESHLDEDYLCWYDTPVGHRRRYSDFIILHPGRGLLFLEVKDWKLDSIKRIDKVSATVLTATGYKVVSNPIEQCRQCAYQLVNLLDRDPQLKNASGPYEGRLIFPYGYGVVLANITRQAFERTDLGEVLPPHLVICKDEMLEATDVEAFQERLWGMFLVNFRTRLTLPQVDRIRWHLFPEIRIGHPGQARLFEDEEHAGGIPDIVRVMDAQQELLARSLGEGHRVIHGVAGSGKTMILGYRCMYLAETLAKPILVLCFNLTLAARLREMMNERGVGDRVNIYSFHAWCKEQLRMYHVETPSGEQPIWERQVAAVIDGVERGAIPRAQYGAVLIDEGHDFEADWLRLVTGMVDPNTDALLLLYDDAQSIYAKKQALDFSLSSVGIQARGRTTILRLNYRNTEEILNFAYSFVQRYLGESASEDDTVPILQPESAGRHGARPAVRMFESFEEEARYVAKVFKHLHDEKDVPWADMCIVYSGHWMAEHLGAALEAAGVTTQVLSDATERRNFAQNSDSVKLMTMHSSKGLEFPVVAVAGVGYLAKDEARHVGDAKLLYVAMTRSTDRLLLTSCRKNVFTEQLLAIAA